MYNIKDTVLKKNIWKMHKTKSNNSVRQLQLLFLLFVRSYETTIILW